MDYSLVIFFQVVDNEIVMRLGIVDWTMQVPLNYKPWVSARVAKSVFSSSNSMGAEDYADVFQKNILSYSMSNPNTKDWESTTLPTRKRSRSESERSGGPRASKSRTRSAWYQALLRIFSVRFLTRAVKDVKATT